MGASLVSIESQTEQDAVFALTGSTGAWLGLTDWKNNQLNTGQNNQHCVWIRPDGSWDDVTCNVFVKNK